MAGVDWDLTALEAMWSARAAAVAHVKASIDTSGMTRPARDGVERAWLEARNSPGAFVETAEQRVDRIRRA